MKTRVFKSGEINSSHPYWVHAWSGGRWQHSSVHADEESAVLAAKKLAKETWSSGVVWESTNGL